MSGCKNKRQRVDEEGEQEDGKAGVDVRLSEELRGLLGGRKYAKESDLTREILLEYVYAKKARRRCCDSIHA